MIAIILAFLDVNAYAAFLGDTTGWTDFALVLNIVATAMMFVSVVATIFSGWDYIKNGKDLLKD